MANSTAAVEDGVDMGPNEKALREIISRIILAIGLGMILFAFITGCGIVTLFCVRHFGPDNVLGQKCTIFCAESGVARNTPKISEKYSHYCGCNDGRYIYSVSSASVKVLDELLFPKMEFHGWWLPTERE